MNKRYSYKLGLGLMSLVAVGTGAASAHAGTRAGGGTATQLAFELAMADAGPDTGAAPGGKPAAARSANGRMSQTLGPDGLANGGAYVEANQIETDDVTDASGNKVPDGGAVMHAYGDVLLRYQGRIIRADQVTYNSKTHVTVANGHTQTINDDGSVTFSDQVTYDDGGQQGVGINVASIGTDNSKLLARRIEQIDANTNRLTDVIYTPCRLCVVKGKTADPTWSIEASRITQRKDKKMVYYDNATVRIHGVPVIYTPYMWTPDPELDRASGFLAPKISFTKRRGFSYEQPYLWSISPYSELIISPQLNAKVNPLLNLQYDRHFYSGTLHARFGYTDESFFDNRGRSIGDHAARDYVLADGRFRINDDWRWSFTYQHVHDRFSPGYYEKSTGNPTGVLFPRGGTYANFFERYNIDDAFDPVGELTVDSRELVSQFNLTRQVENAYFAITMADFQSLQIGGYLDSPTGTFTQPLATDSQLFPSIAPQIEAYWSPRARLLGGQVTLSLNAIGIQHKLYPSPLVETVDAPALADGTSGFDTARVSAGITYQGDMTTRGGLKWGPFLDVRHDYYHESELTSAGLSTDVERDLGTAGFNLSYPLFRRFKSLTAIVEPIAQIAVSPRDQRDPNQPNEDSQSFEFDDTTLFAMNKSPGFDVYEAGARANLGVRTTLNFASGLQIETLVGRTLRDKDETQFFQSVTVPAGKPDPGTYVYDPYGIGGKASDWILDGSFDTGHGIYGYTRLRLDSDTLRISQGETGLSALRPNTTATVRYVFNDVLTPAQILTLANPVVNGRLQRFGDNYRDLQLYARHFFTANWGVSARIDLDLVENKWRKSTASLIYRDDCSWFELVYTRNDTQLSNISGKPSSSLMFRLNFTTLGTTGSDFNDVR